MSSAFPDPEYISSNDIRLAVYELGEGPPVVLLHGFPEIAFSWRHQLPALASAGYRAIAPDQRGYGATDKPGSVGVPFAELQLKIVDRFGALVTSARSA